MGDVDVKVGVVASGDPSGAQQVEQAIKDVGQTAQEVSQQTADAAQKSTEAAGSAAQFQAPRPARGATRPECQ